MLVKVFKATFTSISMTTEDGRSHHFMVNFQVIVKTLAFDLNSKNRDVYFLN